jgi:peptidoglycan/LPS O-acetylase OafA/YrhL
LNNNLSISNKTLVGLNGLRFIAACLVINGHSKLQSAFFANYNSNPIWNFLFCNASQAVTFFFVLSGFLITYLLLNEYEKNKHIKILSFYKKRLLRIFPLYYLILICSTILIPLAFFIVHKKFTSYQTPQVILYFLFLPNIVGMIGKLSHFWSIGVEEQFYLLWAPLVKYCRKYLPYIILLIVFLKWLQEFFFPLSTPALTDVWWHAALINFIKTFHIHYMAMGALGGYFLVYKPSYIYSKLWFSYASQIIIFILLIIRFAFSTPYFMAQFSALQFFQNSTFEAIILPILFLLIIINVSLNKKSLLKTSGRLFDYLGDLSFGMYMFHLPLIYFLKPLFTKIYTTQTINGYYIFYILIIYALTVLLAAVSFKYFESWFKKLRPKN